MKKMYDVSMLIHDSMQVYKDKEEKKPVFTIHSDFETGSSYETELKMNLHTGTHMDFPLHMLKDGKTSDNLNLEDLITPVKVFDLSSVMDSIDQKDLEPLDICENDFVLFKTKNSFEEQFNFSFIYVNESASLYLKSKNIKGVGIDGLGIERAQNGHPTHKHLLSSDIIIIEGLRLKEIKEGSYQMIALPLKIKNVEALPMRIVLIEEHI